MAYLSRRVFWPRCHSHSPAEFVRSNEDSENRNEAIRALAKRFGEDPNTQRVLEELVMRDETTSARVQTIASLAEYFSNIPKVRTLLIEISNTANGKQAIEYALSKIQDSKALTYLLAIQNLASSKNAQSYRKMC